MLVDKNLLKHAVMLDNIKALIIKDTVEIVPELIEKLKELQSELPFWIKELQQVADENKDVKKFDINDYINK
jgi:hypothetical protein